MQTAFVTLVLAAALAQPHLRPAVPPPPYVPIPLPSNAEQLLKSIELDRAAAGMTPEVMQALAEKLKLQFPGAEGQKRLEEIIQAVGNEARANHFDPQKIIERVKERVEREAAGDPLPDPMPNPDVPNPAPSDPKPRTLDQRVGRWLADWLQNEETGGRLVEFMRESPAFQGALTDLLRSVNEVDAGWQPNLPDVPDAFAPPRPPPLPGLGEFPRFAMPELPDAQGWWPKLPRLNLPAFSMPQFPDFSSPNLPDVGGDWPQIVIAVLLVAGLLVAVRLWATRPPTAADRPLTPLPATITTRAELRQAFEALALNRFGPTARPWNHRLVAERFGGGAAIEELTRLYEQARYSPDEGPLSAGDRAAANRSVTELAGGGA